METLLQILSGLHPEVDFEVADGLIDDGILDSLDIVSLVAQIDEEFGVTLPAEEIIPENFNTAEALWKLIEKIDEE